MDLSAGLKKEYSQGLWTFEQALDDVQSNSVLESIEKLDFKDSSKQNNPVFNYKFKKCLQPKHKLVDYIHSNKFHKFIEYHTGMTVNSTLSCWASAYSRGHYLTPHRDSVSQRKITYLFYFHRGWQAEWGGNIAFDRQTHWQMFVPQMGTLVLFDVDGYENRHMVTEVVADQTRYALTGWLT